MYCGIIVSKLKEIVKMSHRKFLKQLDDQISKPNINRHDYAVFILPDQLNLDVWPDDLLDENPLLIFIESMAMNKVLPFHKKKLVYVISSLRHFALECYELGYPVYYHMTENHFDGGLKKIIDKHEGLDLTFMTPSEWDSRQRLRSLQKDYEDRVREIHNTFFFADAEQWKDNIKPGYQMEHFYRDMRRKTGYLMEGEDPVGGRWNFDEENREPLPEDYSVPEVTSIEVDNVTAEVIELVDAEFGEHFGQIDNFDYAVSREQALKLLEEFIKERLADFGPYEDAMARGETTLFHTRLSLYLNNGLLLPWEVCEKVLEAYKERDLPINSVEGLIRQIIGWREFIRIYYEAMMPDICETNFMDFSKKLPEMFWSGQTDMNCMKQSLEAVIEEGYSHHIQRLMVLSNFSNLTKTDPRKLYRWFWMAYVDAYDWVVLPNVLGMATFADGGVLASKPYVSSGNYINKMSNYCSSCEYSITKKTGEKACPFNYLYWNFVDEQHEAFEQSGRTSFMVNTYEKKSEEEKRAIKKSAEEFLDHLSRDGNFDY